MDQKFSLSSHAFKNNGSIPTKYTCRGDDISPDLQIKNVPNDAESLALIVHDPDAVGGDFTHWLIWNIAPNTTNIAENSVPKDAVQGLNGSNQNRYMGACPPAGTGTHHYIFELYALNQTMDLPPQTNREQLESTIKNHIIAKAELLGLFDAI